MSIPTPPVPRPPRALVVVAAAVALVIAWPRLASPPPRLPDAAPVALGSTPTAGPASRRPAAEVVDPAVAAAREAPGSALEPLQGARRTPAHRRHRRGRRHHHATVTPVLPATIVAWRPVQGAPRQDLALLP